MRLLLVTVIVLFLASSGWAQSTRDVTAPRPPAPKYQAVKKAKKEFFLSRWFKKDNPNAQKEEQENFRKRMKQNSRKRMKEERLSSKPQYTDPTYFGHKRPPKKRKPGKRKFCRECGMVH